MKHLLILISILLLSSPVIGQSLNSFLKTKITEMLLFISTNCGKIEGIHPSQNPCNYNLKIRLPKVEIKSAEELKSIGNYSFYFEAMYQYAKETIYIDEKIFDQDNPKTWEIKSNLGLIMHELYHHIQHVNDDMRQYKCHSDKETPAYRSNPNNHSFSKTSLPRECLSAKYNLHSLSDGNWYSL